LQKISRVCSALLWQWTPNDHKKSKVASGTLAKELSETWWQRSRPLPGWGWIQPRTFWKATACTSPRGTYLRIARVQDRC
jgi:hypothetical protein